MKRNITDKIFIRMILNHGIYKIFYPLVFLFPIDKKKIVFSNFRGNGYGDNPKYIAEAVHERFPDAKLIWLVSRLKNTGNFPPYIKTVNLNSVRAMFELATAKFWVDNFRKKLLIPKRKGQFYIQTWHGALGAKAIEKDVESTLDSNYIKQAKKDSNATDVCIAGTQHMHRIFENSFWYDGAILDCGSPRNDILFETSNEKTHFLRAKIGLTDEKMCLYAPTFRNTGDTSAYDIDYSALENALQNKFGGQWKIYIRLHPHMVFLKAQLNIPDFVTDVTSYPDTQELLAISDCVITDYSSIVFDFMLTKRPAFIYARDYEQYKAKERTMYFSLEQTPFSISFSNAELCKHISLFEEKSYKKQVESFLKKYGSFDDGNAGKAVCELIAKNRENVSERIQI